MLRFVLVALWRAVQLHSKLSCLEERAFWGGQNLVLKAAPGFAPLHLCVVQSVFLPQLVVCLTTPGESKVTWP